MVTLLPAGLGVDPARFAGFLYSAAGLGFAYASYPISRVVLLVLPVLVNVDRHQLAAAESPGAGRARAFFDSLAPRVLPSPPAALCPVSAVAIGAYGTALALVGTQVNILPLLRFSKISDTGSDFPAAAALSVILRALSVVVLAAGKLLAASRKSPDALP